MEKKAFPLFRNHVAQVFPFPEKGRIVEENPVCFCWLPMEGTHKYTVTVSTDSGEVFRKETDVHYLVAQLPGPGNYTWNVYAEGVQRGEISFSLAEYAVNIPRISAAELYDQVPCVHPRHLFFAENIPEILHAKKSQVEVLRRNIRQAYEDGIPPMPMYHMDPDAPVFRDYFGRFRDYMDTNLVACALGYALLKDEQAGQFAKKVLLTVCNWNPWGPCSLNGPWFDEVGMSLARCLPSVYDLLYPLLDEKEKVFVARTIKQYAQQSYDRLKAGDFCQNPGQSHLGRLPSYLGEAVLVLKDSNVLPREEAILWLSYALEIYGGIFPYFGTPDGGWAEGPFYGSSYTKWFLPFFSAVERFGGTRFLDRPFYQKAAKFFIHFADPDYEIHPFGDGYWCHPEDAEWPGFFAQDSLRVYAERSGSMSAKRVAQSRPLPEQYLLHLLDVFLPVGKSLQKSLCDEIENTAVFPDAGFVSMHTDRENLQNDVAVFARASKFGSDSHRHADQGSFALFYKGVGLITPSGYYGVGYGTAHHMGWLKQTVAHNAILVDGVGQETDSLNSRGEILSVTDDGTLKKAVLDLTPAYPMLDRWERTIELRGKTITVTDEILSDHDVRITYPLHTLSKPFADGDQVSVCRKGVRVTVKPESPLKLRNISDRFGVDLNEGIPEKLHVQMPPQWHIYYEAAPASNHVIKVTFTVE